MLNSTIDWFYITESTVTFAGTKKEKLYKDLHADIFEPYKDKITWNVYEQPPDWEGKPGVAWQREKGSRNDIIHRIRVDVGNGALPPPERFVVVNTDADEIPEPTVLEELRPGKKWHADVMDHPMQLEMPLFYFNYNWKAKIWKKGNVISGQHILDEREEHNMSKLRMQEKRRPGIPDAGYHLSYGSSVDDIIRKIESSAHQEINKPKFKNREHIMKSITNEENLFYRGWEHLSHYDYKQLPDSLQKVHEEICEMQGVSPVTGKIPAQDI